MKIQNQLKNITASYSHPIKNILNSQNIFMIFLKIICLIALAIVAIVNIYFIIKYLVDPAEIYEKDFIQDYLMAQAILNGIDPYLPMPQLALQFIKESVNLWAHPSPHPPIVAILCLPFCIFKYEHAVVAWFLFEIVCILFAIHLILYKLQNKSSLKLIILIFFLLLAWPPLYYELVSGQLTALLFVLLTCAWLTLGAGKNIMGGIFIGLLIAIKLMAWPFIIFFAIRKNWSSVIAAGTTVITSHLIAGLVMSFDKIVYYYFKVSTIVSPLYRSQEYNFSMWTIGWRFFEGTGSTAIVGLESPPLFPAPFLAVFISFTMPILLLFFGLKSALKARRFDTSFGILICVSVLVNPIAWTHYLILILIPVVIVGRNILIHDMPKTETWCLLFIGMLMFITNSGIRIAIFRFAGIEPAMGNVQIPFATSLLTLIPTISVVLLIWLISRMDHRYQNRPS